MSDTTYTIAFTGGGTGGHVQPIVSLIEYAQEHSEIADRCKKLYWFGETNSMEEQVATDIAGIQFVGVLSGKLRRYWNLRSTLQNIRDIAKALCGFFQSIYLLKKHSIDIVFCKGGYVALPVSYAAGLLRIPIYLHESDSHAGLTNRLVAKIAKKRFVGMPDTFTDEIYTGQILSSALLHSKDSSQTRPDVAKDNTYILVMGGAQGAQAIFEALEGILERASFDHMHFFVLLGTKNTAFRERFSSYAEITCFDFLTQDDIGYVYSMCDIAITRGSVTSLAEQQIFGIKKLIIPLPWTGGNHQFHNACWYSDAHEDIVIEQNDRMEEVLEMYIKKLQGYKKKDIGAIEDDLDRAKKVIWEEMVSG